MQRHCNDRAQQRLRAVGSVECWLRSSELAVSCAIKHERRAGRAAVEEVSPLMLAADGCDADHGRLFIASRCWD